ncbi:hypothetical protein SAMN04244579_04725 [Azotobacter beijerinckii]|uniref:Uncharacterized protein n=1 Tax=Azotobacter beijerinckii TaxID=170623 RepID=A0A1H6ZJI1_9GAMM|nr:hypothetical protein SAMN04244579_04725 [Azotobacter beijerinckii]
MQIVQFLHAAFAEALPTIHARRLEALMAAVAALLQGRCLSLTALGRSMPCSAWPKHAIKRVDHLLGNWKLQAEQGLFYWVMLRSPAGLAKAPRAASRSAKPSRGHCGQYFRVRNRDSEYGLSLLPRVWAGRIQIVRD